MLIDDSLPSDVQLRIRNTARRLDRVYGCCGNDTAAIANYLTNVALDALAEFREGGQA